MAEEPKSLLEQLKESAEEVRAISSAICRTRKEKNNFLQKILEEEGIKFPPSFARISEKEREARLNEALDILVRSQD